MGKFIEEEKLVNNVINDYIQNSNDYSKYIEGSGTFVTYFSKDVMASMESVGLNGVVEIIGTNSPIKFNRINSFPLFNMSEINPSTTVEEDIGIDTEGEGSAVVIPNTIEPLTDDYFLIPYYSKNLLFKITNVEEGNLNNHVAYKIDFELSHEDVNILLERQINKTYKCVYNNLGKA